MMRAKYLVIHGAFLFAVPMYFCVYQIALLPGPLAAGSLGGPQSKTFYLMFLAIAMAQAIGGLLVPKFADRFCKKAPKTPQQALLNRCIQQDAFFEAPAVFGLIGVFLGLLPWQSYSLMAISICLLAAGTVRVLAWADETEKL